MNALIERNLKQRPEEIWSALEGEEWIDLNQDTLQNKQKTQEKPPNPNKHLVTQNKQQEFQNADHHSFAVSEQEENTKEVFALN